MKYVCELSNEIQDQIKNDLIEIGIEGEDLELAMNSKLTDLEDTINIKAYL